MGINEISILEHLYMNENITQRELAEKVEISLGMTNLFIKNFIKLELIKTEKLSRNKVRYIITQKGIDYLAEWSAKHVVSSFQIIQNVQNHFKKLVDEVFEEDESIIIVSEEDEIFNILVEVLDELGNSWTRRDEVPVDRKYLTWQRTINDDYGIDIFRKPFYLF